MAENKSFISIYRVKVVGSGLRHRPARPIIFRQFDLYRVNGGDAVYPMLNPHRDTADGRPAVNTYAKVSVVLRACGRSPSVGRVRVIRRVGVARVGKSVANLPRGGGVLKSSARVAKLPYLKIVTPLFRRDSITSRYYPRSAKAERCFSGSRHIPVAHIQYRHLGATAGACTSIECYVTAVPLKNYSVSVAKNSAVGVVMRGEYSLGGRACSFADARIQRDGIGKISDVVAIQRLR